MYKYKEVYDEVLPEAKRESERKNVILYTIVRPLCIWATLPLLGTNVKPTTVTKISVAASVAGFGFLAFGKTVPLQLLGWLLFFVWVILDGVDGNLARFKKQTSQMGEVWDAFGGYAAMVLTYFGTGIAAFYANNAISFCEPYWMLILGGATAVMSIFPRLMMHKKRTTLGSKESTSGFTNKSSFNLKQAVAMNLLSLSGLFQIIFVLCIAFRLLNVFIAGYFVMNLVMMLASLRSLLKE